MLKIKFVFLKSILLLAAAIFVLSSFLLLASLQKSTKPKILYSSENNNQKQNPKSFDWEKLEIADTEKSRELGLMNRMELCPKCGMLFVFDSNQQVSFWMKDTYISLDMFFVTEDGRISVIYKDVLPLDTSLRYSSVEPIKYVLETSAGFAQKNNLLVGDYLDIESLIKWVDKTS